MARINCAMLAEAGSAAPTTAWPAPARVPDLAGWASLMPADPRERVDAAALAALPSTAAASDVPPAASPSGTRAEQDSAATAAAAVAAQSQGTALSNLIAALAAQGAIDPAVLAARVSGIEGAGPAPLAGAAATLAEHAARPSAEVPSDAPTDPSDSSAGQGALNSLPARPATAWAGPAGARSGAGTARWGSSWPEGAAPAFTPSQARTGDWGSAAGSSNFADWGSVASGLPRDFPSPPGGVRSIYRPLDAPPCDPGLLAGVANVATLYRRLSGRGLADPVSLRDLAGTIESFNACLAALPEPPPLPASLAEWGAAGRGVSAVRAQMGVDLLQPDGGPALQAAIRERQAALATPVPGWMAQRAQAVTQWLELDQLATALGLPVRGAGALARLGAAVRLVTSADLPPCASPTKAAACLARTDDLTAIREGFGIDPLSPGGPARLQEAGATLSRILASSPIPPAPNADAARGLTQGALQRLRQIDRSQAGDLGLLHVNAVAAPVLTSAPLILSVLDAISRQRRASMFPPV